MPQLTTAACLTCRNSKTRGTPTSHRPASAIGERGNSSSQVGNIQRSTVVVYQPNGTGLKPFGGAGRAFLPYGDYGHRANAIAVFPGGELLIAGETYVNSIAFYQSFLAVFGPKGDVHAYGGQGAALV
jgi:hypothetical protein